MTSLERSIGQMFFIGIPGPDVDALTHDLLTEVSPGGVCLFARNIREGSETRLLLDKLRTILPAEPLLSIDQEGGLVDRLRRILRPMPAPSRLASAEDAKRLGEIIGEALAILGFNMDFAPVIDVVNESRSGFSNGLRARNFGNSAQAASDLASAFIDGLLSYGMLNCLKHFPGLGAANVDSHDELPAIQISEAELHSVDLFPYQALLGRQQIDSIMVAHATYPLTTLQERDQNGKLVPSSLSKSFITGLLRGQLGYDGLVITDDLEMGAILRNYGIAEACRSAIEAGADMLAICADAEQIRQGYSAVVDAVRSGQISRQRIDESVVRIERLRQRLSKPAVFSSARLDELSSEIEALSERSSH